MTERENEEPGYDKPVIHDRRRIDPVTGEVRVAAVQPEGVSSEQEAPTPGPSGSEGEAAEVARLRAQLDERTSDLQRLQAEYANYRKRVERDRALVREVAVAGVLAELLPVVDDIGRAREHGELEGGFKSVGESLESILGKLGLRHFGEVGDEFDPSIHEAFLHDYSADVTTTTCVQILQPGYRFGERVIRPARVAVAEPKPASAPDAPAGEQQEYDGRDLDGEN